MGSRQSSRIDPSIRLYLPVRQGKILPLAAARPDLSCSRIASSLALPCLARREPVLTQLDLYRGATALYEFRLTIVRMDCYAPQSPDNPGVEGRLCTWRFPRNMGTPEAHQAHSPSHAPGSQRKLIPQRAREGKWATDPRRTIAPTSKPAHV
jgi:hypothetical protein